MDPKQKLAEDFLAWATQEMKLNTSNAVLPTVEELKMVSRHDMVPILNHFINNVKSEGNVQHIKGNLLVNGKAAKQKSKLEQEKKKALIQEREMLRAKLAETKSNVKKVEMEIGHIKQDLRKEETTAAEISENIREAEQRKAMLNSFLIVMTEQMQTTKQYNSRLSSILENLSEIRRRNTGGLTLNPTRESIMESSSTIQVREASEIIFEQLIDYYNNSVSSSSVDLPSSIYNKTSDSNTFGDLPKDQQMKILQTVTTLDVTPQELLESIVGLTRQSTKELTAEIDGLDFKKEAQELRSAYEKSSETGIRDVFELLQQQRNAHIQRFLDTENNLNQAFDTQLETEKLITERNLQLEKTNFSLKKEVKQLLDLDIEIAAERAAIEVLERAIIEKKLNKKELEKESEILAIKYKQIQQLQKQIDEKQELMQSLTKLNAKERKSLTLQKDELLRFLNTKTEPLEKSLKQLQVKLDQYIQKEGDLFNKVSLEHSALSEGNVPVSELSVNKLHKDAQLQPLLSELKFYAEKGPDSLLEHIVKAKYELDDLSAHVKSSQSKLNAVKLENSELNQQQRIRDLEKRCAFQEDVQLYQWLPLLEDTIKHAEKAIQDCSTIQKIAEEWWTQPAQYLVPWVTVNGSNYQALSDQYHSLCAEFHQSELKN